MFTPIDGVTAYDTSQDGGVLMRAIRRRRMREEQRMGLHLSTVLDDMMQAIDPNQYRGELTEESRWLFQEVGNAVETLFAGELALSVNRWEKPEPRTHQGITGSPDGWAPHARRIDEIKATWKSRREFTESLRFRKYLMQLLFYCDAWDAWRGGLYILFINGDWQPPVPSTTSYAVRWTAAAKENNTRIIRQHAIDRGWLRS